MGRKKQNKEEGEHEVNITVMIAKASITEFDPLQEKQTKSRKVFESPKAQTYFHCAYKLLPDDRESVRTDVVTFGVAAKLYTENDTRVLRTWQDGDKTWVAWTNHHRVRVTKDVLLKMFSHTLELKMWDSKDRVSPRARFDRPKAFKLPQSKGNDEYDVESIKKLLRLQGISDGQAKRISKALTPEPLQKRGDNSPSLKNVEKSRSKISQAGRKGPKSDTILTTPIPEGRAVPSPKDLKSPSRQQSKERISHTAEPLKPVDEDDEQGLPSKIPDSHGVDTVKVKVFLDKNNEPQMSNLMKLAESGIKQTVDEHGEYIEAEPLVPRQGGRSRNNTGNRSASAATGRSSRARAKSAAERKAEARAAYIKMHGLAKVPVDLSQLFTGTVFVNNRLESSVGTVDDLMIVLSLDAPLLSEPQRKVLNPLVIRVFSSNDMPTTPLSYAQLQNRCIPPYISYKFHEDPIHKSRGSQHAQKVTYKDTHVVLLGIEEKEKVFEYLRGGGLEIEVHDRDRDVTQKKDVPTIFGENEDDFMINNASFVTSRRTEHNPFTGKDKPWDPYGIAKVNLSDFLLGEKIIECSVPIKPCKIPDVMDGKGNGIDYERIVGKPGSVDGPEDVPMPAANYLEAGSELKIKIELAYPLKSIEDIQNKVIIENPKECPFARLVYVFDYNNKDFLLQIQSEVVRINAETLQLKEFPQHVIEAALSTYKLTDAQRTSKTLDIVTGFQIIDGKYHIFVLEGIRDLGIKTIWDNLPHLKAEGKAFMSLYNTDITFQERLYASLDVDLTRVRIHQPLDAIVKLPLLYVRDMVPRSCFEAVVKLHELMSCQKLRDAVRKDLFPSAEMIASVSKEFGIPLTTEDLEEPDSANMKSTEEDSLLHSNSKLDPGVDTKPYKTSRPWTPLALENPQYEEHIKKREEETIKKNFLAENVSRVQQLEPIKRERTITCDPATLPNNEAHNYSIQSLNTTEKAKHRLRSFLAEEPDSRFTYSQEFSTATVLPVDPFEVKREALSTSKKEWQTPQGFVFPGRKSSEESNKHPRDPDFARLDELKKPWRENILHANKLKPTVNRVRFSWEERSKDFDNWKKPEEFFGKPSPMTIHLAGDTLAKERRQAIQEELKAWRTSLVVDDTHIRTHRCATETELKSKGFKSASQVARLEDMLKDAPKKRGLLRLNRIPALSVVLNPTVDSSLKYYERLELRSAGLEAKEDNRGFLPGPLDGRSWALDKNKVPTLDYNYEYFDQTKGADFRHYNTPKDCVYRRQIKPLSKDEKDNHLYHRSTTETA